MRKLFEKIGLNLINFVEEVGNITIFSYKTFYYIIKGKKIAIKTIDQIIFLGLKSLPITITTALFVGMAFTVQVVREFLKFGAGEMIGGIVGLAIWRELGPLLTGVVICGRVGAAISAELGTMNVTEQVEALEAMSQNKVEFLVAPRVLTCFYIKT